MKNTVLELYCMFNEQRIKKMQLAREGLVVILWDLLTTSGGINIEYMFDPPLLQSTFL